MAFRLRYYNDPCLRQKCTEVKVINAEVRAFAKELIETMVVYNGVGLAAPQVGKPWRIFIGALGDDEEGEGIVIHPQVYINPKITFYSKETRVMNEGCMSYPGLYLDIRRPSIIDIEAYDENGKFFRIEKASGWLSRNLQHEYDHLDGVLSIDHLPEAKRKSAQNYLDQIHRKYNSPAPVVVNQKEINRYFNEKL